MPWDNIQGKKYPGFGRCIYCGSDGASDGLRDEHIIPFSLGGNTTIENASCRACERVTTSIDAHLARQVFGQYRIHARVQTRNPKDRPSTLPTRLTIDGNDVVVELPVDKHPYSLAMPIWGNPGLLDRRKIDDPFPDVFAHIYHWKPPDLNRALGLPETADIKIWSSGGFRVDLFARGIAKIAYCHAVARFGLDGFRPILLPDLILGRCPALPYFVGVPMQNPPAPERRLGALHQVVHSDLASPDGQFKLLHVAIRLFSGAASQDVGMPVYRVVVGAPGRNEHPKRRTVVRKEPTISLSSAAMLDEIVRADPA